MSGSCGSTPSLFEPRSSSLESKTPSPDIKWIILKTMGPCWLLIVLRHLIFRGTEMGPQFWELPKGASCKFQQVTWWGHAQMKGVGGVLAYELQHLHASLELRGCRVSLLQVRHLGWAFWGQPCLSQRLVQGTTTG